MNDDCTGDVSKLDSILESYTVRHDEAVDVAGELLLSLVPGFVVVIAVRPVSQRQIRPASIGQPAQIRDPSNIVIQMPLTWEKNKRRIEIDGVYMPCA
jgi:hypothetical protein